MRLEPGGQTYDSSFREFDSALRRGFRGEAHGEDIGQHSWVTALQLRADVERLRLSASSRLLDLGGGAGGPLTFVLRSVGCRGTGLDLSPAAVEAAHRRAESRAVGRLATLVRSDLDRPLPLESRRADHVPGRVA